MIEMYNKLKPNSKNYNNIKFVTVFFLTAINLVLFFINFAVYQFDIYVYNVSLWELFVNAGFNIQGQILKIPLIIKFSILLEFLFLIASQIFMVMKKPNISAMLLIFSSLFPIILISTGSIVYKRAINLDIDNFSVGYTPCIFAILILSIISAIFAMWILGTEFLAEAIFKVFACVSVGAVIVITLYVVISGIPAIYNIGISKFISGKTWHPKFNQYGILPLILSSLLATVGAIILGVPIGIFTAIFLSETSGSKLANIVRMAVQLLAGIPSVIYGFFGMLIIVPAIRKMFPERSIGDSLLAVIIILAIMVLPTIVSVSENALRAVPESYKEAALALGTSTVKTIFKIIVPAASSGLIAGIILGVGRAIGETMAVIMVAGNVANMPNLLSPVRLLTTGIVLEMSYSSGLHRQALFAIGLVLFVFIMIVNTSFMYISKRREFNDKK